mgnify:FL=1
MQVAIAKWGHSAALRLPQSVLAQLSLVVANLSSRNEQTVGCNIYQWSFLFALACWLKKGRCLLQTPAFFYH